MLQLKINTSWEKDTYKSNSNGHCKLYTKSWKTKKMQIEVFIRSREYGNGRSESQSTIARLKTPDFPLLAWWKQWQTPQASIPFSKMKGKCQKSGYKA